MSSPKRNLNKIIFTLGLSFFSLGILSSCTKTSQNDKNVNLAIWGNYLSSETQKKFTQETGIQINLMNYSSNEELLAKVQAGASGIDIGVPSDYMVDIMQRQGFLQALQTEKLPILKNIAAEFLHLSFDPKNSFSLPYAWTSAGIAVNRKRIKAKISGWKDFFENPELAGKISVLDDVRELTGAALKMHGFSVNTINPKELEIAQKFLLATKKKIKIFSSDAVDLLKNEEVFAAHVYSCDAMKAKGKANFEIEYIFPKEGGTRAVDNLVIFKNAKNVENAYTLINFLMRPDNYAVFINEMRSGPVLKDIKKLLLPELQKSPVLFADEKQMQNFERIIDLKDNNKLYEDIWAKLKN